MSEITAQNTDPYFQLGCKLSLLTNDVKTMSVAVRSEFETPELKPQDLKVNDVSIQAIKKDMVALKQEAEIPETTIARFVRKLLNLIGITTTYQQILTEIERVEKEAEACVELAELIVEREKCEKIISKETEKLNAEFGSFEEELNSLKVQVANVFPDEINFLSCHEQLSDLQLKFKACASDVNALLKNYRSYIPALAGIRVLGDRVQSFKDTLEDIRTQLDCALTGDSIVRTKSIKVGGIQNGGNTCYIATALQVLNAVPSYRNLFDPEKNPLSKREEESDDSLERRQAIQAACFVILNKISAGTTTSREEINAFRETCYAYEIASGKRIVENTGGQQDGEEVVYNLLGVADYEELPLTFEYQYLVQNEEKYVVVERPNADPKHYRTVEEAKKGFTDKGELSLSATQYGDGSVSMRRLVKDFWKKETLEKHVFVHRDAESGTPSFREYQNVTKVVKFSAASVMPEVLRVFIPQYGDEKATIVAPDLIYPFNKTGTKLTDQTGVGPRYSLIAAAEHMPGHYVAHVRKDRRFIQISDDSVTEDPSSDFRGRFYIYTLVNEERPN